MELLKGKTVLITGATRGIGKGIAVLFAQHGANIVFTYRSSDKEAKLLEKELFSYGSKVESYKSDASDFSSAHELIDNVMNNFGSIDVLVNCY